MTQRLVCPRCGDPDHLETQERAPVLYPATFTAGQREPVYTGERAGRVLDGDAEWDGTVHCTSCEWTDDVSALRPEFSNPGQPPRPGERRHAYPREMALHTTCTTCGGALTHDGQDEPDSGPAEDVWSHDETGHYWCD